MLVLFRCFHCKNTQRDEERYLNIGGERETLKQVFVEHPSCFRRVTYARLADRTQEQGRPSFVPENPFEMCEENISGHHPILSITAGVLSSLSSCRIFPDREVKFHLLLQHVVLYMPMKADILYLLCFGHFQHPGQLLQPKPGQKWEIHITFP